jgi:FKBP-type peptidyl-prolyl cis-trans isomerase
MRNSIHTIFLLLTLIITIFSCKKSSSESSDPAREYNNTKEQLIQANRVLVKKDKQRIAGHIKRMGWTMHETETGLWYEILKEGEGDTVTKSKIVTLNYSLSLLDGTLCYSSANDGQKVFEVGHGGVESGLEQGVLFCKKGSHARLILPPHLAHGLTGDGVKIPARAILVYEIEVKNVENKP